MAAYAGPDGRVDQSLRHRVMRHWKAEDQLELAVKLGVVASSQARDIRGEGERVLRQLDAQLSSFCDGWGIGNPTRSWPIPELPCGWEDLSV